MGFSTKECSWNNVTVKMLGATLTGIRGFEIKPSKEKEFLYAAGGKPIDIQEGNEGTTGNLKLLKYEVDKLNDAALLAGYKSILDVPHEGVAITVGYKKRLTDPMRTLTVLGVAFTELPYGLDQAGKMTEVTMPFMAMDWLDK